VKTLALKLILTAAMVTPLAAAAFAADDIPLPLRPAANRVADINVDDVVLPTPPAAPAPPPAPAPATRPATEIQKWFEDLAAPESAVRERARVELMGLTRDDLQTLRQVVQRNGPPTAAQAAGLHDVVVQVYLAGETYQEARPRAGFLGVRLGFEHGQIVLPEDAAIEMGDGGTGVPVADAMPGFCGFRALQRGDVVMGVDTVQWTPTPTAQELINTVSTTPPGRRVTLHVVRHGRMTEIPIVLSARPRMAEDPGTTGQFLAQRERRANEYWLAVFAPLMGRDVS